MTMNTTVTGSSFVEVTQSECLRAAMIISNFSVLIQFCIFSNSQVGIYSTHSAITIDSCTFVNNSLVGCTCDITPEDLYDTLAMVTVVNGPLTSETVAVTNSDFIDSYRTPDNYYDHYITKSVVLIESVHDGSVLVLNNSFVNNTEFHKLLEISSANSQIIMDHNDFCNNEIIYMAVRVNAINISITITHNNLQIIL